MNAFFVYTSSYKYIEKGFIIKKNDISKNLSLTLITLLTLSLSGCGSSSSSECNGSSAENVAGNEHSSVSNEVIAEQRTKLAESIVGHDVGAQSPRDIDSKIGVNTKATTTAPASSQMNLCDIHFHKSAEHKGGEFTTYAGNGNGEGYGSGYKYSGTLTKEELTSYTIENEHNPLYSGDTIEVHYVYTTNTGNRLGHGLGTCLEGGENPLLRVEAEVYVLVNDENALDFTQINAIEGKGTSHAQASHIPDVNATTAVQYEGSTTGPGYNETFSPYQVTWSVRPHVERVNIKTVQEWFEGDGASIFEEEHAHGVRNLVTNKELLSPIE